ncbi:MAG TPA: ABC transporter substrate-binding protein [Usitatibacteraceae bacterium]
MPRLPSLPFRLQVFSTPQFLLVWLATIAIIFWAFHSRPVNAQSGTSSEILIGQVADFSGPLAGNVKEGTEAVRAYFDKVNKSGGVNGRKLVLQSLDDGYDPKKTVALAQSLIDSKSVLALVLGRGTANAEALMPLLKEKHVPMVGFAGGSVAMHVPANRYFFNLRPPYRIEAERAIGQLFAQGITTIAAVYTDDAFGKDAVLGIDAGAANSNIKVTGTIALERGSANVDGAITMIMSQKPGAVIAICTVKPCAALRKGLQAAGYLGTFLTLSNTSSNAFITELGEAGRGVIVTQVFPSPESRAMAVSVDFQKLAEEYKLPKSYTAMEGYVYARVLVEAIKRAGANPTHETLTEALQSDKKFDLGGYVIAFSPTNRTGSQLVDLTIITKAGKFLR